MTTHRDTKGRPLVAVTGLGVVTSLGQGKETNWQALTAGKSGIHRIERFPTEGLKTSIGGTVDFLFDGPFTAPQLSEKLATLAAEEAVGQSGIGTAGDFPGELLPDEKREKPVDRGEVCRSPWKLPVKGLGRKKTAAGV